MVARLAVRGSPITQRELVVNSLYLEVTQFPNAKCGAPESELRSRSVVIWAGCPEGTVEYEGWRALRA